jgi:hypothetical protein
MDAESLYLEIKLKNLLEESHLWTIHYLKNFDKKVLISQVMSPQNTTVFHALSIGELLR